MSKAPLENVPQERAVLGALISNSQALWIYKDRVPIDLFVLESHRRIAKHMHELIEAGRETTIAALVARMPEGNQDWSPAGYLATLVADEAEPDHLSDNITDLEDMWARRQMMRLGQELMTQATEDNGLGSLGRLEAAREKMDTLHDPMGNSVHHISDIAMRLLEHTETATQEEETVGVDLGLKGAQDLLGPLMPGRMYLLPGSSGSGKSALGQQIARHASFKVPVLFYQLEMEGEEMVERDLASTTAIPADKIERAALNFDELGVLFNAADDMRKLKLYIDSGTAQTVAMMRAKAMRMKRLKGLGLVVVDHLLLIQNADRRKGEFDGLRANLQALKRMAKDLQVPVLVLTQLKGSYSDGTWNQIRPPSIGDIYGGSANEHDPDAIMFVYREEYLLRRKEPAENDKTLGEYQARLDAVSGKAELILAKRRGGRGAGKRSIWFDEERVRFCDQNPGRRAGKQDHFEFDETKHF